MRIAVLLLGCMVAFGAHADIYKRVDASGQVTYTDQPIKGAKRMNLVPLVKPTVLPSIHKDSTKTSKSRGESSFPRIDSSTQSKRDSLRRTVLQNELHEEQQALTEALNAKKEGEKLHVGEQSSSPSYLERISKIEDTVKLHRDNVNALSKELSLVK